MVVKLRARGREEGEGRGALQQDFVCYGQATTPMVNYRPEAGDYFASKLAVG